ncbi:hypothetical protein DM819_15165 [Pseudomonas hunanensis]|uniref:Uncharacterized protein n=1 Tax=Pseudomonas hunanensis TaxID=1247546 RepID=A0ABD6N168_9PSED|nr:hypothetical protein [Pseudomonas hunanensis]NWL47154.1 hypothetical protein [Pseudomonas hunanensis]
MQTAVHKAFEDKRMVLAALLERSQQARNEAFARIAQGSPRYQASSKGGTWDVVEIATGEKQGFAYSYKAAMRFVDACEAGAASKTGARQ